MTDIPLEIIKTDPDILKNRKKLHIILPGGGVNGCFQAGFLYELYTHYKDYYELYRLDCTSVGALNGYAFVTNNIDKLMDIWLTIKHMNDVFPPVTYIPVFVNFRAFLNSFYSKGLYSNEGLKKKIWDCSQTDKETMSKFNCVVTDVQKGEGVYVNGTDDHIQEYVLASSSPWIITSPQIIDEIPYTDGALFDNFPIKFTSESEAELKIVVGYDGKYENLQHDSGDNVYTYLQSLIDICRRDHYKRVTEEIKEKDIILIDIPIQYDFLDFDQVKIKEGFELGQAEAHKFAEKYFII